MVITDVNQVVYLGDGETTAFPFTFRIIDATDVKLLLIDAGGTETDITSDYFVDTVNNTVHYPGYAPGAEPAEADQPAPVQTGQRLVVYRELPITQEKDLGDKWPFFVIELGLDKLTMILQQIYGWWGRTLKFGIGWQADHPDFDTEIPIEAGKTWRVNDDGTGFVASASSEQAMSVANQAKNTADAAALAAGSAVSVANEAKNTADGIADTAQDAKDTADDAKDVAEGIADTAQEAKDTAEDALDVVNQTAEELKTRAVWCDNMASMRTTNLSAGMVAATKGYYSADDDGNGFYFVRTSTVSDVDDGGSVIILNNGNVAELITSGTINAKQFGAKGDGVTDDTTPIQKAIAYIYAHGQEIGRTYGGPTLFFPFGTYCVSSMLTFNWTQSVKIKLDGAEIKATTSMDAVIKCQNNYENNSIIHGGIIDMNHVADKGIWLERTNTGFMLDNITIQNVGNGTGLYLGNPSTLGRSGAAHIINNITVTDYQGEGVDGGSVLYQDGIGIDIRVNDCYFNNVFVYCIRRGIQVEAGGHNFTNIHVWHNMSPDNADWEDVLAIGNMTANNVWDGLYIDNYARGIYTVSTSITQYFYYIPQAPSTSKNCSIIETWTDSVINVGWLYTQKTNNCEITVCKNNDPNATDRQSNNITIKHNIKSVDGFNPVDPAFDIRYNKFTQSFNNHYTEVINTGYYLLGYLSKTTGIGKLTISVPAYGCASFLLNTDRIDGIVSITPQMIYSRGQRAENLYLILSQSVTINGKAVYPVYLRTTTTLQYTKFLVDYISYGMQEFYLKSVKTTDEAYVSSVTAISTNSFYQNPVDYLPLSGGTMTGNIVMGSNNITIGGTNVCVASSLGVVAADAADFNVTQYAFVARKSNNIMNLGQYISNNATHAQGDLLMTFKTGYRPIGGDIRVPFTGYGGASVYGYVKIATNGECTIESINSNSTTARICFGGCMWFTA